MASPQGAKIKRTYQGISSNITVAPYILSAKQISDWVVALNNANSHTNPQRRKLYELYNRVELDGQIETVTNLRTIAVTNKQINFLQTGKEGEVNDALMEQIRSPWFSNMLTHAMSARFWGHSLIEFKLEQGLVKEAVLVPRTNVNPETSMFFPNYAQINNNNGILYKEEPERNYCFEVHGTRKLGLFSIMAPYVLYKAGAIGDLAQFCELFAIPFREVKYNPFDPDSRKLAQQAMEEMGSAGYVVLPQGTEFVIHDTKGTTSGSMAPSALIQLCDEQIAKAALGGTMTTDNGSSMSQAKVHYEVKNEINLNDMIWVEYLLNWEAKQRFIGFGLPVSEGKFEFDKTREIPLETRVEMDVLLSEQVPIAEDYWYHTYGIPQPKSGQKVHVKESKQEKPTGSGGAGTEKKKLKLGDIHLSDCGHHLELSDIPNQDEIASAFEQAVEEVYNNPAADKVPLALYNATANILMKALFDNWNKAIVDIKYDMLDNALISYLRSNIFAFSAGKSYTQYKRFGEILLDEKNNIKSLSQFKKALSQEFGLFNDVYLQAEYNHAIASAQSASFWVDAWANRDKFPNLKWVTAGDARVRPSHSALNGITLPIEDKFWDGHPVPLEWGCRCQRIQVDGSAKLTDRKTALERASSIKVPKYFKNSGKTGVIYSDEHNNFQTADVYKFTAVNNYGMRSVDKMYSDPSKFPTLTRLKTETDFKKWESEMIAKHGVNKEEFVLTDNLQNKVLFDKNFLNHPFDNNRRKKENRWNFHHELENVLQNPDEVWSERKGTEIINYHVKFYADTQLVLRVNPELKSGFIKAFSFYELNQNKESVRVGILMHKKTAK